MCQVDEMAREHLLGTRVIRAVLIIENNATKSALHEVYESCVVHSCAQAPSAQIEASSAVHRDDLPVRQPQVA